MADEQNTIDPELARSTNEFLHRAGELAEADRAAREAQRREWRGERERRREWNAMIDGGQVAANGHERSVRDLRPASEMTKEKIVGEARELHAHCKQLHDRFETSNGPEKLRIREEMKPLVTRENELREEYTGRVKAEVSREVCQDRVPEVGVGYGR